jgi:hypothetical protein
MLVELLEYLVTPCARPVRRLGYLYEAIAIRARAGRCRTAWAPHLEKTRNVIRKAARRCPRRRKAVVLGSGLLLDVPLSELARDFEEVVLVDVIHPLGARLQHRRYVNVKSLSADVTGATAEVCRVARLPGERLPRVAPDLFVGDAEVDLVVSVNLLSQLPYLPVAYLKRAGLHTPEEIESFARGLVEAHVDYLRRLPGVVALIADVERQTVEPDGKVVERIDALHGVRLPWTAEEEWIWRLAPRPEAHRRLSYQRRVVGISDVKCGG